MSLLETSWPAEWPIGIALNKLKSELSAWMVYSHSSLRDTDASLAASLHSTSDLLSDPAYPCLNDLQQKLLVAGYLQTEIAEGVAWLAMHCHNNTDPAITDMAAALKAHFIGQPLADKLMGDVERLAMEQLEAAQ